MQKSIRLAGGVCGLLFILYPFAIADYKIEVKAAGTDETVVNESYRFIDPVEIEEPSKEFYSFEGYYKDEECTKETQLPNRLFGNRTYYALFEPDTYEISLTNEEGNETDVLSYKFGEGTKLPVYETDEQHIFDGWEDEKGNIVINVTSDMHEDIVLTPSVSPKTYNLYYELNGGVNDWNNPVSYKYGDSVQLQNPTKEGYDFGGWYTDSGFLYRTEGIENTQYGDTTFYALWLKPSEIVGTEDTSEGSGGRIDIPSGNFHAKLYWGTGEASDQSIVDAEDSAYIYNYLGKMTIGDHAYQGFKCISNADVAYLTQGGVLRTLYKASQYGGYNSGYGLILDDGRYAEEVCDGEYCLYTCDGDRVIVTYWN